MYDEWEYEPPDGSVGLPGGWFHVACPNAEDGKGCVLDYQPGLRDPIGVRCLDCGAILDFPEPDYESMVRS